MPSASSSDPALELATETLYRFFAASLSEPSRPETELLFDRFSQRIACEAADVLRANQGDGLPPLGFGEQPADELDLRPLVEELARPASELVGEYTRVFGFSTCRECPPYETEYHKAEEAFFRSQQMADIAGFYKAFGLTSGGAAHQRPDYLPLELEFLAYLLMKKRLASVEFSQNAMAAEYAAVCQAAHASFFRDHLSWWVPSFALALRRKAMGGIYAHVGRALAALMPIERQRLGVSPPRVPLEASVVETRKECDNCLLAAER